MDDSERLATQASLIAAANPLAHTFVYRNLVKGLAWATEVRVKLEDPAFSGFFIPFKPGATYHVPACDDLYTPPLCSALYHDQSQSPAVPGGGRSVDGACVGTCSCGSVPCGEYVFDWRNGSMLQQWIIEDVIFGPTGLGHPNIDGLFM